MKKPIGYDEVEVEVFSNMPKLDRGNYICKILDSTEESTPWGAEVIRFKIEINEGEFAGYFDKRFNYDLEHPSSFGDVPHWKGVFDLFLPESRKKNESESEREKREWGVQAFKRAINDIEADNPKFHFDWNAGAEQFEGLIIGVRFQPQIKMTDDGKVIEWQKPKKITNCDYIRSGKCKIMDVYDTDSKGTIKNGSEVSAQPERYVPKAQQTSGDIPDEELPF